MSKASLVLLLAVVGCIKVPLNANQERCMVVFTYDASDSIKLHLKFPKAKDQKDNEFWYVSIENTKTMQRETKEIPHGNYRHEIEPQEESKRCFIQAPYSMFALCSQPEEMSSFSSISKQIYTSQSRQIR
jgi:hypothetical protein